MFYVNKVQIIAFLLAVLFVPLGTSSAQENKTTEQSLATKDNSEKTLSTLKSKIKEVTVANSAAVDEVMAKSRRAFEALTKNVDDARKLISSPTVTINDLLKARRRLDELRKTITNARGNLKNPVADYKARLKGLGPSPKKGESEAESITLKRQALSKVANKLQAVLKQLDLLELEADQLGTQTSSLQKAAFVERVFISTKSILNPKLWWEFTPTLVDVAGRTASVTSAWNKPPASQDKISGTASFLIVGAVSILSIFAVLFVWAKMANPPAHLGAASDLRRIWRAVGGTLVVAAIGLVSVFTGLAAVEFSTVTDLRVSKVVIAFAEIVFSMAIMITVLRAVFAPSNSLWRVVNIDDPEARQFFRYGLFGAVVFGLDRGAGALADITFLPLEFVIGVHAIVSLLLIFIIGKMVSIAKGSSPLLPNTDLHSERTFYFVWARRFFLLIWGLLLVSMIALFLGYVALAHFLLTNLLVTGAMVIILYLLHHLVDALVSSSMQPWSRIGKTLRSKMSFADENIRRLGLILSTITDVAVILLGLPLILGLWTITWVDFSSLATQAFFGFKVGDVFVEPSKIVLAIVMLIVGGLVVRTLTLWLNKRILDRSDIDPGVQHSISTGVKYTGIILAIGFALSAAGLDFSKLAIVAGALSVGIGFGMQSVVSNFVSGLILLAERPISIGHWVEVSAGEGVVTKINVRSTEIQTFDRCTVVIPNSTFISEPVKNWSLGSSVGRIKVNIGVGYGSDPELVEEILLNCAQANDGVVMSPPPRVIFMDFGASSLDFQLRVFLADIGDCTSVASDLRFAMFRELKAANIEIPFPQRDINIRDVDKIAQAITATKPTTPKRKTRKAVKK